jgi:hypothetical protein
MGAGDDIDIGGKKNKVQRVRVCSSCFANSPMRALFCWNCGDWLNSQRANVVSYNMWCGKCKCVRRGRTIFKVPVRFCWNCGDRLVDLPHPGTTN